MDDWGYYVLENDIDLAGTEWKDPGNFRGYFDGQGHTIKNMNFVGTVENANFNWGLFNSADGVIENLTLQGRLIAGSSSGDAGGLCATSNYLTIENCVSKVNISVTNNDTSGIRNGAVGGFIGRVESGCIVIKNSANHGSLSNNGDAGGFIGRAQNGPVAIIICISNSYNDGFVSGNCAGGLIGESSSAEIVNCYSSGKTTGFGIGPAQLYGLIGYGGAQKISSSYFLCDEEEKVYESGLIVSYSSGEHKDTVEEIVAIMKDVWDNDVWDFENLDGNGNPTLKQEERMSREF